ncbi:MAG: sulfotransferase [Jiangellaceae bacterium]
MTTPPNGRQDVFPFFVGSGRSGTTLVRAIFDSHPELAIPDEVSFIIRFARPHYALRYGWPRRFDVAACADLILHNESFRRWGIPEDAVLAALADPPPSTFADTVRRLYALWAAGQGKPRYGDKTPMHVQHLHRLGRMFPEARFVHIIRDGRDVALSYLSVAWGPSTIEGAAVEWRRRVRQGRRAGRRLGSGRYREIRYEDLVADPERVVGQICQFLGLPWDDALLRHHERADDVIAATRFPAAHQRLLLPPTTGLRDWREEMATDDVTRFEAIAGPVLDELGYERSAQPSPGALMRATSRVLRAHAARSLTAARAGGRVVTEHLLGRK